MTNCAFYVSRPDSDGLYVLSFARSFVHAQLEWRQLTAIGKSLFPTLVRGFEWTLRG